MTFSPPTPAWMAALPEPERAVAQSRFLLRLAALYHSPGGKVQTLSESLGLHPGSLASYEQISADLAVRLEKVMEPDGFHRSLFRPDLFNTEG